MLSPVTSLAEVWIETSVIGMEEFSASVTSLAEVWIETRETYELNQFIIVTSLAEVWIETMSKATVDAYGECHFPCGSVD